MFYISGYFDREELVALAESVRRKGEEQTLGKPVKYVMTELPERYTNVLEFDENGNFIATNSDEEGHVLHFYYGAGNTGSVYIEEEGYDVTSVTVCGQQADLYLSIDASNSNGIIWSDRYSGMIFFISAHLPREDLIVLAQSGRVSADRLARWLCCVSCPREFRILRFGVPQRGRGSGYRFCLWTYRTRRVLFRHGWV